MKMVKGKRIREKGKVKLSEYFKKVDVGNSVAVRIDKGESYSFPDRLQGRSGKIIADKGKYKIVEMKEGRKAKQFIIHPVHLKKI